MPATNDEEPDVYRGDAGIDLVTYAAYDDQVAVTLDDQANDGHGCPQVCEGDDVDDTNETVIGSDAGRHADR